MDIHKIYRPILTYFRRGRMQLFANHFGVTEATTVLDVGGGLFNWRLMTIRPKLTILNPDIQAVANDGSAVYVNGDGCSMQFPDKSFDVVFSNSVIEHVGDRERQKRFADECMRCGRGFYVQTPNKWFPIDPHTFLPLAHWLPPKWFKRIMKISPRFLISRPAESELPDFMNMRLLGRHELQQFFPEAEIIEEKFLGITKSLIAVSRPR